MMHSRNLSLFLILILFSCESQGVLPLSDSFSIGTLTKITKAPDMGVGSVSIGTDTNQGFAGIGAVGFPPISGGNNKFYAYNPATQSWSTKAALPQPYRYQSLVFATSGKLYVLGGYNYYIDKIGPPIHYKAAYYKDFWQYDIGSDKWTKKNDLPIDSADFNKCVAMNIGEKGFLLLNNNMWEYNERNDQWDSNETYHLPHPLGVGKDLYALAITE